MGFELELVFKGADIKALTDLTPAPSRIFVVAQLVDNPEDSGKTLLAAAIACDANGQPMGEPKFGCPTPCHPIGTGGGVGCQNASEAQLDYYLQNNFFSNFTL
jgi:hypothetical protein